eukprot:scaffold130722_cov39-Phaeocystis_antarctica.AAC.1
MHALVYRFVRLLRRRGVEHGDAPRLGPAGGGLRGRRRLAHRHHRLARARRAAALAQRACARRGLQPAGLAPGMRHGGRRRVCVGRGEPQRNQPDRA